MRKALRSVVLFIVLLICFTSALAEGNQIDESEPFEALAAMDVSSFSEQELEILNNGFEAEETIELTPRLVSLGKGVTLTDEPQFKEKKITIPLSYSAELTTGASVNVSMTVTYSATAYASYRYDKETVPDGYLRVLETIAFNISTEGSFNPMDVFDFKPGTAEELLTLSVMGTNVISVSGATSVYVESSMVGNCSFTLTRVKGCKIDSLGLSKVIDEEPFKPVVDDLSIAGSLEIGISGSLGMYVPVLGQVCGINMNGGVEVGFKPEEQFDHNVKCYDIPITFKMSLNVFVKIGLKGPEGTVFSGLNWTLVKKTLPLHKAEVLLALGHLEMTRRPYAQSSGIIGDGINVWDADLRGWLCPANPNDIEERVNRELCTVKKDTHRTIEFYTGTLEKIESSKTVVGQAFDRPNDPTNVNKRVHFIDWYTEIDGGEVFDFAAETTEDTPQTQTVYARWSEPYYTVTIDTDVPGMDEIVHHCPPGTYVEKPYIPLRMEYHFDKFVYSYALSSGGVHEKEWIFERDRSLDQDITIHAKWIYEKGYNPFEETAEAILSDENFEETARMNFENGYSIKINTYMTGAIAGRVDTSAYSQLSRLSIVEDYRGSSPIVCIPDHLGGFPVTYVDGTNFSNKEQVEGLILPGSVQMIRGFKEFPNLQYVYFRDNRVPISSEVGRDDEEVFRGIKLIEKDCFRNCPKLSNVIIPSTIEYIGNYAFANSGLEEIAFDFEDAFRLGDYIFEGCSALHSAQLPDSLPFLTTGMFKNCTALKDINLSGIRKFYNECLRGTGLESINIKDVEHIGEYIFCDMPNLTQVRLATTDQYTYRSWWASFSRCPNLKTIHLEAGAISPSFHECPMIETLYFNSTALKLDIQGFENLQTVYAEGNVSDISINKAVALKDLVIDGNAQSLSVFGCDSIQSIHVSQNVRSRLYLTKLPELNNLRIVEGVCGTESSTTTYSIIDCPKLERQEVKIGDYVKATIQNAGIKTLDYSELPGGKGTTVSISGCDSLQSVILPKADDATVNIQQSSLGGPRMITVPEERESVSIANWVSGSTKAPLRVVIEGTETAVESLDRLNKSIVMVAPQGSSAWKSAEGNNRICLMTPEEAAAGVRAVFLSWDTYYMSVEGGLPLKVKPGEQIPFPTAVMSSRTDVFKGWVDEADGMLLTHQPMPNRDIFAYGSWESASVFSYRINKNGEAVITSYTGSSQSVGIPEEIDSHPVTGLEIDAFSGNTITDLSLPSGIKELNYKAIRNLSALKAISVENEMLMAIEGVVYGRDEEGHPVALVFVPRGMDKAIVIPETVTSVSTGAVEKCENLPSIVFQSKPVIEDNAILNCPRLSVYGPIDADGLETWCDSVAIPYNQYLLTMHVTDMVYEREVRAGSSLEAMSVDIQGYGDFAGWTEQPDDNPASIILLENMPAHDTTVWAVFNNRCVVEDGKLTSVSGEPGESVTIPEGVATIVSGAVAFEANRILIPSSVLAIENGAFIGTPIIVADEGSYAEAWSREHGYIFEKRKYLLHLNTDGGAPIEDQYFEKDAALNLPTPVRTWSVFTGWYMDEGCTEAFTESVMPGRDTVLYAGWSVIREMCFTWSALDDGEIQIEGYYGSDPDVLIPSEINGAEVVSIAPYAFYRNETIHKVALSEGIREIGERAFWGSSIHEIVFGGAAPVLGVYAFADCDVLERITVPDGVALLPEGLFSGCDALLAVELPDSLTEIEKDVYNGCTRLKSLTLPANLKQLNAESLSGAALTSIFVKENNDLYTSDGNLLFTDSGTAIVFACNGKSEVIIPEGIERISARAFFHNTLLESVSLPESLSVIETEAFRGTNLKELILPGEIADAGDDVFPEKTILYIQTEACKTYAAMHEAYSLVVLDKLVRAESILLSQHELAIPAGQSVQLNVTVTPVNATDVGIQWISANERVAIAEDGVITAKGIGETVIYAVSEHDLWDYCKVTVVPGCELSAGFETAGILTGVPTKLQVTCSLENMELQYTSNNSQYASISEDGTVIADWEGTYTFTVKAYKDGFLYAVADVTARAFETFPCISFDLGACMEKRSLDDTEYYWTDSYCTVYLGDAFPGNDYDEEWIQIESENTDILTVYLSSQAEDSCLYANYGHTTLTVTNLATGEVREYLVYAGETPGEVGEGDDEWSEPTYEWSDDYSTVTAQRYRWIEGELETETETVLTTKSVWWPPEEYEWGLARYTSEAFKNDAFLIQDCFVYDIPSLSEMTVLQLPQGLKLIQNGAFSKITSQAVILPNQCVVEEDAFSDCEELIYVYVPYDCEVDQNAFSGCEKVCIYFEGM